MSEIKAGDVVEIKSGGPRMVVVTGAEGEGEVAKVWVQWFCEGTGEFRTDNVALICLKKHEEESSPCKKCTQIPVGQQGEYPCSECGLPTVHDGE